jgi:hypothetical protein
MNYNQFVELVREMRFNQKQYFKHRTQNYLDKSKTLEKQIDKYLEEITAKPTQHKLF